MPLDHNYLYYAPLKENDVVVILGATHGDFVREYKNEILAKNITVINVEPTLEGVLHLSNYIKQNMPENACVVSCAIADIPTTLSMDIRDNLITSTLENRPETNERWPMKLLYKQKTLVLTLDNILEAVGKVDKLFMDIEGSEIEVLLPSEKILTVPYVAVAAYHIRNGQPTSSILTTWFEALGYKVDVTGEASTYNKHEVVLFARR